jgi:chitodextrinase
MKKKLAFVVSLLIFVPLVSFAAQSYYAHIVGCEINTIPKFFKAVLAIVIKVGIPVASVFLIWAGFLFLTAQGNESKLARAKKTFVWACIGFGVLLASWLLAIAFETVLVTFSGGSQNADTAADPCALQNMVIGSPAPAAPVANTATPPSSVPPPGSAAVSASPSAPTQVRASSVGNNQIMLTWSPSTASNVIGYNVYQNKTLLGTTAGTSFTAPVTSSSLGYMYTIVALTDTGAASVSSAPLFTSVSSLPASSSSPAPSSNTAIPIVSSNAVSPSRVDLTWTAVSNASGYTITRDGTRIGTASGTSYSDTTVKPGMYVYTVAANSGSQLGDQSMPAYVFVKGDPITEVAGDTAAPTVPANLKATAVSDTRINLTWSTSTDDVRMSGYKIYRNGTQIGFSGTTSYTDGDGSFDSTQSYTYTVSAFDFTGNESAKSASVKVSPLAPPPPPDSGSGSGGGSSIPPFSPLPASACTKIVNAGESIQSAVSGAGPGSVICVHGGTYHQTVSVSGSGNSSSPIIIQAYPGESVVIDGQGNLPTSKWAALVSLHGNYINIYGFEVKNTVMGNEGRGVGSYGHHNIISHFNVHNIYSNGILATGDYSVIEDSVVWKTCMNNSVNPGDQMWGSGLSVARDTVNGITDHSIIRRNISHDNWGEGISSYEANGTLLENNIAYNNWSVNLYISDSPNTIARNNLVYNANPNQAAKRPGSLTQADEQASQPRSSNVQIVNNIVYGTSLCNACWTLVKGMSNINANHNTIVNGSLRMDTTNGTGIVESANCTLTASQVPGLGTVTPGSLKPSQFANASCPSGTGANVSQFSTQ